MSEQDIKDALQKAFGTSFPGVKVMKFDLGEVRERSDRIQDSLRGLTADGSAGGDMVVVTANGMMEITKVKLSVELSDKGFAEDLILLAVNQALKNIKDKALAGGLFR